MTAVIFQPNPNTIPINIGNNFSFLPEELVLLEASVNYTTLYFLDGRKLIFAKTLKAFEEKFNKTFLRTHKSFLVNPQFIVSFDPTQRTVNLQNGSIVFVSRRREKFLKKWKNIGQLKK